MSQLAKRLALALASVVLLLALLEGALQLLAAVKRVRFDPHAPVAGTTRILCIGDSHTFGLHLNRELQSYPAQLGQRLRLLGTGGYEVENRGIPGQSTAQMRASLPVFLGDVEPSIVLVLGGINNTWNAAQPSRLARLLQASRVYRLACILISNLRGTSRFHLEQKGENELEAQTPGLTFRVQGEGAAGTIAGMELARTTEEDLRAMIAIVRRAGAVPVLMTYATEREPPFVTVNDAARRVSKALDVPLVDHAAAFRQHHERFGYEVLMFGDDHHPKALGYKLMVDGILARFHELGWIPQIPPEAAALPPRLDEHVTLALEGESRLVLRARPGLVYEIVMSRIKDPPQTSPVPLPFAWDVLFSQKARDVPQLTGRVYRETTIVELPSRLLEERPIHAAAIVFDQDGRIRGVSDCVTIR